MFILHISYFSQINFSRMEKQYIKQMYAINDKIRCEKTIICFKVLLIGMFNDKYYKQKIIYCFIGRIL